MKMILNFKFRPPEFTRYIHFSIGQDSVEESRSSFTKLNGGDGHKYNFKLGIIYYKYL